MMRGPFVVKPNAPSLEAIRSIRRRARALGIRGRVAHAFSEIEGHLELHPESWGEIVHRAPAFKTTFYRKIHDGIRIEYAVHDLEPNVFIVRVSVHSDHPLAE